jgi:hypothetical protein
MDALDKASASTTLETIQAGYDAQADALAKSVNKTIETLASERAAVQGDIINLQARAAVLAAIGLSPSAADTTRSGKDVQSEQQIDGEILTLRQKLAADTALIRQKEALAIKTEQDLEAGNWTVYYADLLKKAQDAVGGVGISFKTLQSTQKTVADEMTANAQTATDGWNAGLAKIQTSIQSFGQNVTELMTTVFGQMTSAADTGFFDILSGKFSDLSNVLKNLWDSVLKDFSKMLEQMLTRWITTGDAMGNGQGSGGLLGSFLGGSKTGGAGAAPNLPKGPTGTPGDPIYVTSTTAGGGVQTPGGTSAISPTDNYETQWDQNAQPGGYGAGPGTASEGWTETTPGSAASATDGSGGGMAQAGMYGAILYGGVAAYQGLTAKDTTSQPTYQGQNLGVTADFGGPGGGAVASAAVTVLAASVAAGVAIAAAAGELTVAAVAAAVPVVGWIAAAALLIVAVLMTIFAGPQEGRVPVAIADAFSKSGATTVIGNFVNQIISGTADFVGSLALKAGDNVAQYQQAYQKAFQTAYGKATFDIHAGSPSDLQTDVNNFFSTVLPTLAMKAAFGQTGYGYGGNSNVAGGEQGGIAGTSWNANNPAIMDAQGNWVKQQLYDPQAPIPLMLDGLHFTATKIGDIASMLAGGEDIKTFETYLQNLITVVAGFQDLVKQMSRSTSDWYTYLTTQKNIQGTAAQFAPDITNIEGQGALLEGQSATDQVTTAQTLLTSGQAILTEEQSAFTAILGFINQIQTAAAAMIQSYQQKLTDLTEGSSQKFHEMSVSTTADYQTMLKAANPADTTADWQKVQSDFSAMLDGLLAEIQQVMQLQQSYATFRAQMASDAGPQFATDPNAWLAQNMTQIDAITTTLKTATGSDAITDAQTLLSLVQTRYSNELAALQKVNDAIKSIDAASQTSIQNLTMQGMGSVTTDASGNKAWTPDIHAQGEYLNQQYNSLMGQLGSATTSDEVTSLMSQINSVISQLAAQPQDPSNYAASRQILIKMQQDSQDAADKLLKTMHDSLTDDLKGIGDLLKAGETSLDTTLKDDTWTYDQALHNFTIATTSATTELNGFADALTTQMGLLVLDIQHWLFILENTSGAVDPLWDYTKNAPNAPGVVNAPDVWQDDPNDSTQQICVSGPDKGQTRKKPTGGPQNPKTPLTPQDEITAAGASAATFTTSLTDPSTGAVPAITAFVSAVNDATHALNGAAPATS